MDGSFPRDRYIDGMEREGLCLIMDDGRLRFHLLRLSFRVLAMRPLLSFDLWGWLLPLKSSVLDHECFR